MSYFLYTVLPNLSLCVVFINLSCQNHIMYYCSISSNIIVHRKVLQISFIQRTITMLTYVERVDMLN